MGPGVGSRGTRKHGRHAVRPAGPRARRRTWDRRPNPERRAQLLLRVADQLLEEGLASFTLRRAAAAAGTSAQLLVHHFGTKERLVDEALAAITKHHLGSIFGETMAPGDFDDAFWTRWARLTSPEYLRFLPLMYETLTASVRSPKRFTLVRHEVFEQWQKGFAKTLIEVGVSAVEAQRLSTAYVAALRGLLLDLLVTGERERVAEAVRLVAENLKRDLGLALGVRSGLEV
jgi:AcrR family transcriptional regulator